ncbi:hypothetical protein MRX96_001353 [Rhipicephalus microplus]
MSFPQFLFPVHPRRVEWELGRGAISMFYQYAGGPWSASAWMKIAPEWISGQFMAIANGIHSSEGGGESGFKWAWDRVGEERLFVLGHGCT